MPKDVAWSAGFIAGAAIAGVVLKLMQVERGIVFYIVVAVCGIGSGWMLDRAVSGSSR